jgi:hypothetical protein
MSLWQKGFVDGNMEDEDPMITVTQKGFEDKEIESLQPFEKAILENLKVYLYEQ